MANPSEYGSLFSLFKSMVSSKNNLYLEGAESFNCFENIFDQIGILEVYMHRIFNCELDSHIDNGVKGVDECALAYRKQKMRFESFLTEKCFDVVENVPYDYPGRIAMLTHHGTVIIADKNEEHGRKISMWRIHSYEFDFDGMEGFVVHDLKLGKQAKLFVNPDEQYISSILRGLAVSADTSDLDALEDKVSKFVEIPDYLPEFVKV